MMWLKNTGGKKDSMFTFAVGGFIITSLAVLSSFMEKLVVGDFEMAFRSPDVALITVFLGSTLTAYVARRNKKDDLLAKERELRLRQELSLPEIDVVEE